MRYPLHALLIATMALAGTAAAGDADRYRARDSGPEGAAALARVLEGFHARGEGEQGFAWWMGLPIAVRARHVDHAPVRSWRNRIEFLRDAQRGDAAACAYSGPAVLADPALGCALATELGRYRTCVPTAAVDPALRVRLAADLQGCPQQAAGIRTVLESLDPPAPP